MKESADFLLTLLHAVTNTHLLHWTTKSYAEHKALGKFYEKLPDLIDALAETLMGKYGVVPSFKGGYYAQAANGKAELEELKEYVETQRKKLPQDSEIQNEVDNIANLINQTLFLLRFP